jgi:PAS domain S-box-containing protein
MNPQHPNELRDRISAFGSDTNERKITEQALVSQKALLSGIAGIFHEALTFQTEEELGEVCLRVAEEITESRFGFIGEIKGQHLEHIAISNPGWDACAELDPHGRREPPGKFELHGIYGRVLLDGKGLFTNDPTHHPDRVGLPVGHPPLESFLGVPLIHEGRTIGMIGLANRPGGYTISEQESVETLAPVIVEAFIRKRAEQALRESEDRFHRLFEDDLTGDFLCTAEGRILLCNPAFAEIFGFSSSDEAIGTSFLDLCIDLEERESMLESLKQQGKLSRYEAWRKRRNGELIYVVENIVGHFDDRGELFEMQGYIFDDTERKEAEIKLEETGRSLEGQKNLLQHIIDSAKNHHLVYLDRDFNFAQVNETYARTCGYKPQEMVGKNHFALYPHEENQAIFARVRDTGVPVEFHDKPFVFPDQPERGTTYWDWTLTPVRDPEGAVKGLVFSLFETTQRKRMEEDLRKSRDELERRVQERTAELQQANERLKEENQERIRTEESLKLEEARLDALLQLSQISQTSLKEITNFTLEQAIRLTNSKIGFVGFLNEDESVYTLHAVSKDVVKECNVTGDPLQWHVVNAGIWAEAIREHRTLFVNDYSKPHPRKRGLPPGHPYVERFMVVPILEVDKIIAVAGVGNKASDYNKSDERQIVLLLNGMWSCIEKNRSREELENAYKKLEKSNSELAEYNRQLKALNQELQDFAFVASHDLNEPLRKIRAFGDMVTQRLADFKDETSKDYLNRMRTAAARMQTLLNSLLSYSRVTTKAKPMKKTDLRRSVKEALSNLEISIGEKNADVEIGDLPTIKADVVQMTQLFQNLIGNALKFHREGEAPHVKIHSKEVGDAYEIYVEDNGIGFDEKYLDKIFLPFQRLHGRSSEYEGVGMGLAICRKVVDRHNGAITARSEPGKGSTFIVTLPRETKG